MWLDLCEEGSRSNHLTTCATWHIKRNLGLYSHQVFTCAKMSAYVISNAQVTDSKFTGTEIIPKSSFQQGSSRNVRKIMIAVFIVILLIGIALLAYFLATKENKSSHSTLPQFKAMEDDMKKSVDPCNDFYEYSCGMYIDRYLPYRSYPYAVLKDRFVSLSTENTNNAKKALDSMSNTNDPFFKKAFLYNKACMTSSRTMDPYFKAADDVGGSDITTIGMFDYKNWNLETALQKLKLQYNTNPLFTVHVAHDLFNTSRNIFMIKAPDTSLLSKLAGEKDEAPYIQRGSGDVLEDDFDVISSLVTGFSTNLKRTFATAASKRTGKSFYDTYYKVSDATNFERKLIQDIRATMLGLQLRNIYKVVTVGELNNITNHGIRWSTLLQSLFPAGSSFKINNKTEVGLMVPVSYLDKVKGYLTSSDRRDLPNYFAWLLLKKYSPVLPDDYFAQYYFGTSASYIGTTGKERWRACMLETEMSMPLSVGMMFAKAVITPRIEKETSEMLVEIQNAFKIGSKKLSWLDQVTKNAVDNKIKHVLDMIAGPNLVKAGWLNDAYKNVQVNGRTLFQMFESAQRNIVQVNMKRYGQPTKRDEFDFGGFMPKLYDVNAFYDRSKNLITVLSGILRRPFIFEDGPSYINFAKVGAILGHELLHGFDSKGWNFDKFGQISPWTTKHSQDGFKVKVDCVKKQYDRYYSGSNYINGTKTLAENIADNAGLKYAYLAYKSLAARKSLTEAKPAGLQDLSYDQLFFIGYAQMWCRAASNSIKDAIARTDTHSPNRYRVIGSVSNFEPFANAFKCRRGAQMSPINRCEFW